MTSLYFQLTVIYTCGCAYIRFTHKLTTHGRVVYSDYDCHECEASAKRRAMVAASVAECQMPIEREEEGAA